MHSEISFENFFDDRANIFGDVPVVIIRFAFNVSKRHDVEDPRRHQILEFGVRAKNFITFVKPLEVRAALNQFAQRFFQTLQGIHLRTVLVGAPAFGVGGVAANVINFRRLDINLCQEKPVQITAARVHQNFVVHDEFAAEKSVLNIPEEI